jgi:hypothetical protein
MSWTAKTMKIKLFLNTQNDGSHGRPKKEGSSEFGANKGILF